MRTFPANRPLPTSSPGCFFSLIASRSYSDQLLRRTMAVFYGQFKVETFRRQMKENRKIEELILMFATHATSVLRKDPTLSADGKWNVELNNHIVQFVKLLRESLRSVSHVSPELTARLDVYAAKLAPSDRGTHNDSGYDSSSTSHRESMSSPPGSTFNVADMSMVNTVAKLFQIRPDILQPELDGLRSICTERVRNPVLLPHSKQVEHRLVGCTDRFESALERRFLRPRSGNPNFFWVYIDMSEKYRCQRAVPRMSRRLRYRSRMALLEDPRDFPSITTYGCYCPVQPRARQIHA